MPDAKSVDGAPAPRPLIRKRILRKPIKLETHVLIPESPEIRRTSQTTNR